MRVEPVHDPVYRRLLDWTTQEDAIRAVLRDRDRLTGALQRTIPLLRRVAKQTGAKIGYTVPAEMDRQGCASLRRVQSMGQRAPAEVDQDKR